MPRFKYTIATRVASGQSITQSDSRSSFGARMAKNRAKFEALERKMATPYYSQKARFLQRNTHFCSKYSAVPKEVMKPPWY